MYNNFTAPKVLKAKVGVHLNSVQSFIILAMMQLHAVFTAMKYTLHAKPARMMHVNSILLYSAVNLIKIST